MSNIVNPWILEESCAKLSFIKDRKSIDYSHWEVGLRCKSLFRSGGGTFNKMFVI